MPHIRFGFGCWLPNIYHQMLQFFCQSHFNVSYRAWESSLLSHWLFWVCSDKISHWIKSLMKLFEKKTDVGDSRQRGREQKFWRSFSVIDAWKSGQEIITKISRCRALCWKARWQPTNDKDSLEKSRSLRNFAETKLLMKASWELPSEIGYRAQEIISGSEMKSSTIARLKLALYIGPATWATRRIEQLRLSGALFSFPA